MPFSSLSGALQWPVRSGAVLWAAGDVGRAALPEPPALPLTTREAQSSSVPTQVPSLRCPVCSCRVSGGV